MVRRADIGLVTVSTRGELGAAVVGYAERKLSQALEHAPEPVLSAHAHLSVESNPAMPRPAVAKVAVEVNGRPVRAHVAAETLREAIDLLEGRLQRQLDVLAQRTEARHFSTGVAEQGEWRHGNLPTHRPDYLPRPVDEREIVRRKALDDQPLSVEEAVFTMLLLDYDFYLFMDPASGADSLVSRSDAGPIQLASAIPLDASRTRPLEVAADAPVMSEGDARTRIDTSGERFVFFVSPADARGRVLYRRFDGHYGLIEPRATAP